MKTIIWSHFKKAPTPFLFKIKLDMRPESTAMLLKTRKEITINVIPKM